MSPLTRTSRRARALTLALIASCAWPSIGRADDEATRHCVADHESAQDLRRAGKLRNARTALLACASQQCPALVRADCGTWLTQVEASLPTIVFSARDDAAGVDVVDVRVSIDGEVVAERLDGKALAVDPGAHALRFTRAGAPPVDKQVVIREGEHNRLVEASFGAPARVSPAPILPPPREPAPPSRVAPIVLGGVSALGFASFGYFGITGRQRYNHDLDPGGCGVNIGGCSESERGAVHDRLLVADISLGVAVVALGAAAYLWFSAPSAAAPSASRAAGARAAPALPWWSGRF